MHTGEDANPLLLANKELNRFRAENVRIMEQLLALRLQNKEFTSTRGDVQSEISRLTDECQKLTSSLQDAHAEKETMHLNHDKVLKERNSSIEELQQKAKHAADDSEQKHVLIGTMQQQLESLRLDATDLMVELRVLQTNLKSINQEFTMEKRRGTDMGLELIYLATQKVALR